MIRKPGPATLEELAEIHALRHQADATGEQIADTVAALADRLASASPPALARKKAAQAWAGSWHVVRRAGQPSGTWRTGRAVAAGLVIVVIAVTRQYRRRA